MTAYPTDLPWTRRLKLRHLHVITALETAGSITAAAKAMHMTQPALSHWLSDMEDLVGTRLFTRGRKLELTEAGRALWRYACRVLGDTARTGEEIDAIKDGVAGHLHIGTILSAAPVLLPHAIASLHQRSPNIRIELVEGLLEPLIERLERREIDLILGPLDIRASRSGLCTEWLMTDSFSVVARRGHPLTCIEAPTWSDTQGYPWILPPLGILSRVRLDQAIVDAGMPSPKPVIETSSLVTLLSMLQGREYIATLASSVARMYEQLNLIEIINTPSRLEFGPIGMLWSADSPSIVLPDLRETLREEARRLFGSHENPSIT